jgi:hypothetical protein
VLTGEIFHTHTAPHCCDFSRDVSCAYHLHIIARASCVTKMLGARKKRNSLARMCAKVSAVRGELQKENMQWADRSIAMWVSGDRAREA